MSIYDIKYLGIKNTQLVILFILEITQVFSNFQVEKVIRSFLFAIFIFLVFFVYILLFENKFGGGDVKVITLLTLNMQTGIIYVLLIASFLGVLFILITKKEKIPFIPFITTSYIIFSCFLL